MIKNWKRLILFICSLALLCNSSSLATELNIPRWQKVQQKIDCDGYGIIIDAVTDLNIPNTASELQVQPWQWTEDELRDVLSVVSPGDEDMKRQPRTDPNDIALFDVLTETNCHAYMDHFSISHIQRDEGHEYAAFPTIGYHSYEPIPDTVPDLTTLRFSEAMEFLKPVLNKLNCKVGYPAEIKMWDRKSLQDNYDLYRSTSTNLTERIWTTEDEQYAFSFPVYYNNIRLCMNGKTLHDNFSLSGGSINAVIDHIGIVRFWLANCIFTEVEILTQPQKILTLTEALKAYQSMRASMLIENEEDLKITKILLEYLILHDSSNDSYQLIPAWCFYHENANTTYNYPELSYEAIHAITGKPID